MRELLGAQDERVQVTATQAGGSMKRIAIRILMSLTLVGLGWAVGKAQTTQPDFEIVDASGTDYDITPPGR
jgi:hypothetical protein